MAFIFPENKADFTAPNGISYHWDGQKWVVNTFKIDDSVLDEYATVEWVEQEIADAMLDGTVDLTSYATKSYSDAEDAKLQLQIDELEITKGSVAKYEVKSVTFEIQARPGGVAFNSADATLITTVSFSPEDQNGNLTRPVAEGDIVEFDIDGDIIRFQSSGDDTNALEVTHLSGTHTFAVGQVPDVYIYPQNEAGASKDYVDDALKGKVDKNGDEMKGLLQINNGSQFDAALLIKAYDASVSGNRRVTFTVGSDGKTVINNLIKSTRESGFAFEVKPEDSITRGSWSSTGRIDIELANAGNAAIRTVGSINVKKRGEAIDGTNIFSASIDRATYNGPQDQDYCLATKKYVDDHAGGGGVELWGGDSPPPASDRGTLLLTKSNALYIYTAD